MQNKEPLFRMTKRSQISFGMIVLIHLIALVLALIVCAVVIVLITHVNPLGVYSAIYEGAVGNSRRFWVTVRETVVLLLIAVGLTPAFRMRFWNVGAEGQILMGGMISAALMIYCGGKLPNFLLILAMLLGSILAGMIWGLIPAYFKAKYNTNETLFTLMMNYVAMQLVNYAICFWENPKGSNTVGIINKKTNFGWFPSIAGNPYILNVLIVLAVTLLMSWYLRRSKQGFEIAVVGSSQNTARYAGINVKRVQHGQRPRIHGHHRRLDVRLQPAVHADHFGTADLHAAGRDPDRDPVQAERELFRHHHRHYPVFPDRV